MFSCIKKGIPLSRVKDETLFSDIMMMKYQASGEKAGIFSELADRIDKHYNSIEGMYKEGSIDES